MHIVDLGRRLADVEAMGLDSDGASAAEINFLRQRRVELNAMPCDVFVRFVEGKLTEHGIGKSRSRR